ncbi:MAG TPA: SpoIIE family protein phosphatase [Ktedonobacterales bacterium]|nr:SpoIIE family protein phosphatase [Ktedonobacterales bacterium]
MAKLADALKQLWPGRRAPDPGMLRMPTADLAYWITQSGKIVPKPPQGEPGRLARARQPLVLVDKIQPDDPIVSYFLSAPGPVDIEKLSLDSPTLRALREAGAKLIVPLLSQGELVGLLHVGPRRGAQDYSLDDRGLLNTLATQTAPAVHVAQLVQEREAAIQERERLAHEMLIARLIQQTLLPRDVPVPAGWQMAAHYQPARAVGGDFYDFIPFRNGRLGLVVGDVTDKGVPAALVMAMTRSVLRAAARRLVDPAKVLRRVNDLLYPDIPRSMFITCFYALLDPISGVLRYANAGHDLPYRWGHGAVSELRATGMPLGLMPGMRYEERETLLAPGESALFYSDGLVEAHNPQRELFGFPRLKSLLQEARGGSDVIPFLMNQLAAFTGADWEQEDDVTLLTLHRQAPVGAE